MSSLSQVPPGSPLEPPFCPGRDLLDYLAKVYAPPSLPPETHKTDDAWKRTVPPLPHAHAVDSAPPGYRHPFERQASDWEPPPLVAQAPTDKQWLSLETRQKITTLLNELEKRSHHIEPEIFFKFVEALPDPLRSTFLDMPQAAIYGLVKGVAPLERKIDFIRNYCEYPHLRQGLSSAMQNSFPQGRPPWYNEYYLMKYIQFCDELPPDARNRVKKIRSEEAVHRLVKAEGDIEKKTAFIRELEDEIGRKDLIQLIWQTFGNLRRGRIREPEEQNASGPDGDDLRGEEGEKRNPQCNIHENVSESPFKRMRMDNTASAWPPSSMDELYPSACYTLTSPTPTTTFRFLISSLLDEFAKRKYDIAEKELSLFCYAFPEDVRHRFLSLPGEAIQAVYALVKGTADFEDKKNFINSYYTSLREDGGTYNYAKLLHRMRRYFPQTEGAARWSNVRFQLEYIHLHDLLRLRKADPSDCLLWYFKQLPKYAVERIVTAVYTPEEKADLFEKLPFSSSHERFLIRIDQMFPAPKRGRPPETPLPPMTTPPLPPVRRTPQIQSGRAESWTPHSSERSLNTPFVAPNENPLIQAVRELHADFATSPLRLKSNEQQALLKAIDQLRGCVVRAIQVSTPPPLEGRVSVLSILNEKEGT